MTKKSKELSYEDYSALRKQGHVDGTVPTWMQTAGLQMFYKNYLYEANNPREQFERIAKTLSKYAPFMSSPSDNVKFSDRKNVEDYWYSKFFGVLWSGHFCGSTPLLANTGTDRGLSVSCSGGIPVDDSVGGFYDAAKEVALLTKEGFGTAVDVSAIRPRGSPYKGGGKASGALEVMKIMRDTTGYVSQGSNRRGAVACYIDVEHKDFYEIADYLEHHPDELNVGWKISDKFMAKLDAGNKEAHKRFKRFMYVKAVTGKGYFYFPDKAERLKPEAYKVNNLTIAAPQLCNEIFLFADEEHTYTCVLGWMNLSKYNEWKNTDAVFVATVLLDCVVSYFLDRARNLPGLEKAVRMTEKGRAIGLGAGGLHTLFQQEKMPFESVDAFLLNREIFKHIDEQSLEASKALAKAEGEPEWCKGLGIRFTHRIAVAPTKSTALIYGGISEGINPDVAFSFIQSTAAGEVARVTPVLLETIKSKGLDVEKCIADVDKAKGSVQGVSWLTPEEKSYFKTGFEIPMESHVRMTSDRQKSIDQGQSFNLDFDKRHNEEHISYIHQLIFKDERIKGAYYVVGKRESGDEDQQVVQPESCVACQ